MGVAPGSQVSKAAIPTAPSCLKPVVRPTVFFRTEGIPGECGHNVMKVPKQPRVRRRPREYSGLRRSVFQRDRQRCQSCGSSVGLDVPNTAPRSQLGHDAEENLIGLCGIAADGPMQKASKGASVCAQLTIIQPRGVSANYLQNPVNS